MSRSGGSSPTQSIAVPKSGAICDVSIIDTTTRFVVLAGGFVGPVQKGHETMNMPAYAFLIRNRNSGKQVLFDLGCRKDWWNLPPGVRAGVKAGILGIEVSKSINEVLTDAGIDAGKDIAAIILSHGHFDHIGDISLFPKETELWTGPGFKERFIPGYPTRDQADMMEVDFTGREVTELDFEQQPTIGGLPSFDFFGDGSLYLLRTPGHAVGHMSALVRTTSDTFVLLGGDFCHFGGQLRPTAQHPMPEYLSRDISLDSHFPTPCPCVHFQPAHRDHANYRTKPFYLVSTEPYSFYEDPTAAQSTINQLEPFDSDPNIFTCIAHDGDLPSVVDFFPKGTLNAWKERGWKGMNKWSFVNHLPVEGKPGRPLLVPGLFKEGRMLNREEVERL